MIERYFYRRVRNKKKIRERERRRGEEKRKERRERERERENAFRAHIHRLSNSIDRHWLVCLPARSTEKRTSKNWLMQPQPLTTKELSRPWCIAVVVTRRIYRYYLHETHYFLFRDMHFVITVMIIAINCAAVYFCITSVVKLHAILKFTINSQFLFH